jgi:hypothetical protein
VELICRSPPAQRPSHQCIDDTYLSCISCIVGQFSLGHSQRLISKLFEYSRTLNSAVLIERALQYACQARHELLRYAGQVWEYRAFLPAIRRVVNLIESEKDVGDRLNAMIEKEVQLLPF